MRCTYFFFEGAFQDDDPDPNRAGCRLFSTAMVPNADADEAHQGLVSELAEEGVTLIAIEDSFIFDPDEVDFSDPHNILWISIYEEVVRFNRTILTPFNIFRD